MKNVISISLGSSSLNFDVRTRFLGQEMRLRRLVLLSLLLRKEMV